ncbi:hypothetical protein K458DRAFT_436516 [Lentithecium fluviatile CBS 122367]|uniref:Uncharacterized protein n=1 Tax=Lentithecium fluviatile CBS 122367 TaxID=1168545 RepID=A0A6G1IHY5_9PLEO|nr:hypothetical protein K458DRAFT_436516 [Lentithecium fluviatile CBS 122367]
MSLGWADNVLLAVGPIGIMTIVVSAVRVRGTRRLRALVGRSRESKATGELELLTSTSEDVCEMWNGNEVVRAIGVPHTKEEIIRYPPTDIPGILIEIILVFVGLFLCSHIIEGSVTEFDPFECRKTIPQSADEPEVLCDEQTIRVIHLQPEVRVGNQLFSPYLIGSRQDAQRYKNSRRNDRDYSLIVSIATLTTTVGYLGQFISLLALYWSVTLLSLGTTLFMSAVHLWVRRGTANPIQSIALPRSHPMEWAALYIDHQISAALAQGKSSNEWYDADLMGYSLRAHENGLLPFATSFFPHFEVVTGGFPYSALGLGITETTNFPILF